MLKNEVKKEIPSITNLPTTAALTAVENKIPNVSDLVKKLNYDEKASEIQKKYFTTSDYNKFTSSNLEAKIRQKNVTNKFDLNQKIKTLATKEDIKTLATNSELKAELKKLKK